MNYDYQPIQPITHLFANEKEKRDYELWNAITTAIHLCGYSGVDVTEMGVKVLKELGRYDLLPPCIDRREHFESKPTQDAHELHL